MEFACPVDLAGVEIDGIEKIMHCDFVRKLEIARVQAVQNFLVFKTLLREFGDVIVGIGGTDLRLFRFAVGGDGCVEVVPAGDDRRSPAEASKCRRPFDIGSFLPFVVEFGVDGDGVGCGSAETRPFGVSGEGASDKEE